jgi:hypothetical protein
MSGQESDSSSELRIVICDYGLKYSLGHHPVKWRPRCKERAKFLYRNAKGDFHNRCPKHCPSIIRTLY